MSHAAGGAYEAEFTFLAEPAGRQYNNQIGTVTALAGARWDSPGRQTVARSLAAKRHEP